MPACSNTNTVFERYAPESRAYKNELAKQWAQRAGNTMDVVFDKYEKIGNTEYLHVLIRQEGFCATGIVEVRDWHKMEGIRRTNGLGYSGALLQQFAVEINEDPTGTKLFYKDIRAIVD